MLVNSSQMSSVCFRRYKTSFCREYAMSGTCHRRDSCTYAHAESELERYKWKNSQGSVIPRNPSDRKPMIGRLPQPLGRRASSPPKYTPGAAFHAGPSFSPPGNPACMTHSGSASSLQMGIMSEGLGSSLEVTNELSKSACLSMRNKTMNLVNAPVVSTSLT